MADPANTQDGRGNSLQDYENMVAVATKQRLLWDTQNAAAGDAAQGAALPTNDAERKRCKREDAAQAQAEDAVFPMNKRNAQRDVTRAAKQIVQDAVFPTSKPSCSSAIRSDA